MHNIINVELMTACVCVCVRFPFLIQVYSPLALFCTGNSRGGAAGLQS